MLGCPLCKHCFRIASVCHSASLPGDSASQSNKVAMRCQATHKLMQVAPAASEISLLANHACPALLLLSRATSQGETGSLQAMNSLSNGACCWSFACFALGHTVPQRTNSFVSLLQKESRTPGSKTFLLMTRQPQVLSQTASCPQKSCCLRHGTT